MWKAKALAMFKAGVSQRGIARELDVPKSTVNDFLREWTAEDGANVLIFDIETAPMEGYFFDLWPKFIDHGQIIQDWSVLTWSAKWLDDPRMMRASVSPQEPRDDFDVCERLWHLFDAADVIVAHNGDKFDVKRMNTRFLLHGLPEPNAYRTVDTLKIAKRKFAFPSNRLDYISKATGGPGKVHHEGFSMWRKCLEGDADALRRMQEYNDGDVIELERVYKMLRGWDHLHPNMNMYSDAEMCCPVCGSEDVEATGLYRTTQTGKYPTFRCQSPGCGKISHSGQSVSPRGQAAKTLRPSR